MQQIPRSSHSITAFCQRADWDADRWSSHHTSNLTAHLFSCFLILNSHLPHIGERKKLMSLNWSSWTQFKGNRSAKIGYIIFKEDDPEIHTDFIGTSKHFVILRTRKLIWPEQYVQNKFPTEWLHFIQA